MTGGELGGNSEAGPGSRFELRGGTVGSLFVAHPDSQVVYSGGKFANLLSTKSGSTFTIQGAEFRLDGKPITELATVGDVRQIDIPETGVLSGTLRDGATFAFSSRDRYFAEGTLSLELTEVPAPGPHFISVPNDPAPLGLRSGQTLLLGDGGDLGDHFTADWGSTLRMTGGHIGWGFQSVGSAVNITGGNIETLNALYGSIVNVSGGSIDYFLDAYRGAIVNVLEGGTVGNFSLHDGGRLVVDGGSVGNASVYNNSSLRVTAGTVRGSIRVGINSSVTISGGDLRDEISITSNSNLKIVGGRLADGLIAPDGSSVLLGGTEFRINGELLEFDEYEYMAEFDLPDRAVLSGVFFDGSPFAFSSDERDRIGLGVLRVSRSAFGFLGPGVSGQPLPSRVFPGLKPGETMTLNTGEQIGDNLTAGWESSLTIDGGAVGDNFEAVGAQVDLVEGSIGREMDAFFGSVINIHGGTVDDGLDVHDGGMVNVMGGIFPDATLRTGSQLTISGGTLGSLRDGILYAGGSIAMEPESLLHVIGSDFLLNGHPIENLQPGASQTIELGSQQSYFYANLQATLADGTILHAGISNDSTLDIWEWEHVGLRTLKLTFASSTTQVPEPTGQLVFAFCALLWTVALYRLRFEKRASDVPS